MQSLRRWLVLLAAMSLFVAACGTDDATDVADPGDDVEDVDTDVDDDVAVDDDAPDDDAETRRW
jgi:hypothetical protein